MIETNEIIINSLSQKPRKAYVYLPTGYESSKDKRYPVIYMFDGHNLFSDSEATYGRSWRLADYLDYTDTQVIVAAVECNNEGKERLSEYSPIDFVDLDGDLIKGKGDKYMKWLINDFKKDIDTSFRTLQDRKNTAIAGSSMGGLMSLFALAKYNSVFSKAAALSPSIWVGGNDLENTLKDIFKSKISKDSILYMDYGSKELSFKKMDDIYAKATGIFIKEGINVTSRIVPNGTHSEESWEKQIPIFMQVLGFKPRS